MSSVPEVPMSGSTDRTCWCGSHTAHAAGVFELDDGNKFPLVRCDGCGAFALFPQPDDEQLLSYYSQEYYGASRRKFIRPIAGLVSVFQSGRARSASRHTPAGGTVLDIGCGNGGFLIQMKQRGFQAEGTEWTAQSAARVPAQSGIKLHVGDLLSLQLPEQSYDLVTIWHVLEHVRQPYEMLMKIKRLLKPNGWLMLSLPNAESPQSQRFGINWFHHDPPRHLFGFGPQSIERLLNLTGFEIDSLTSFSLEQNLFGYIQSCLNARGAPRDRLYQLLKGSRQGGRAAEANAVDLTSLFVLLLPSIAITTVESLTGRGATMTIQARAL